MSVYDEASESLDNGVDVGLSPRLTPPASGMPPLLLVFDRVVVGGAGGGGGAWG